jgi:hypothetical protein
MIAPRDHVAPETPLSEKPLVPKSCAAGNYRNLRAGSLSIVSCCCCKAAARSVLTRGALMTHWPRPAFIPTG